MKLPLSKKILIGATLCGAIVFGQTFAQQQNPPKEEPRPTNLKVLPKNISGEELHTVMRGYSRALGVRCGYCHVAKEVPAGQKPQLDFASDAKGEKKIAREMMKMTAKINKKYLGKIGKGHFEQISCVTCHMGRTTPIVSVDSLAVNKK